MRALPAFCLLLMPAISAQTTDATQQIVESLYPKSQRLKETRISDLVSLSVSTKAAVWPMSAAASASSP
jgi:hypothetical protein